ncbi:ATP-binding protein [Cognataquiflexum aquatile]|uniref:ATP-binding protein n=1 Tax=Cognataquiflexum aquatile TaxID=2249427 RepID=UPI000DEB8F30|nr:tetratricopeptide repeat-containing sensor histidine kinase [Cognataquiflexum aquatile]
MKRSILFILLFSSLSTVLFAQADEIDSLNKLLSNQVSREERVNALNHLTFLTREKDLQQAFVWGQRAEELALELNDSLQITKAKGNLGWIYFRLGVWDKAFRYSKDSYLIALAQNYKTELGMALNNLGSLYYRQENYDEAIKNFKEAYTYGKEVNDPFLIIRSLNNLALNYTLKGELDSAYTFAKEAIESNEKFEEKYFITFTHRVIGDIYLGRGEVDKAIQSYEKSLQISTPEQIKTSEASVLHRLGNAYFIKGNSTKALGYLDRGLKISKENGLLDELVETYKIYAKIYDSKGNIPLAFKYQKAFNELNAEREAASNKERMELLQAKFEVEKSDAEINFLKVQNSLKELEIKSFKKIWILFAVFTVMSIGLLFWMSIIFKKKQEANKRLQVKRSILEEQKKELQKKSAELTESNRSKNRILSILGHDLKSPVAQLKGVLDLLHSQELSKEEFDGISHILKRNVDGLYENIDNILSWSKSQMEGFKVQLLPTNIKKVIRPCLELLQYQANSKEITITTNIIEEIAFVDQDLLQLIIRNLLSNAIKFSNKGSNIDIYSQKEGDFIKLVIQDYGLGMSEIQLDTILNQHVSLLESSVGTDKEKGTGLGLNLCKEFLGLMGGSLMLESKKGEGTTAILLLQSVTVNKAQQVV